MKRSELTRRTPLRSITTPRRRPISEATPEQRAMCQVCIVTGVRKDEGWTVDPAHLTSRAQGGCNSVLCVVGLRREVHEAFDRGEFDLLPYLLAHRLTGELCHALEHYEGNLVGLLNRLTGDRYVPEERAA